MYVRIFFFFLLSGPHLSAFTVPTFSRTGFIGELGPVKTSPCPAMCAHNGVCSLACVNKTCGGCLDYFWPILFQCEAENKQKMLISFFTHAVFFFM